MVKKVGKYELGRSLGEGTFGKVKYALDTETNEGVAIKILDKEKIQKQNMGNQIKKEISIMKMVKHKYVVGMVEVLASKTKIFIVLELVTGGELFDKIVQVGKLNEDQARFYFQQLVEGVAYCHSLGVCHRDLKPENLLLDEHGNLKISDFGLSSLYVGDENDGAARTELLHTTCGTPNYVAPEVLSDKGYDGKKADVWSCGVILYVLLAGFLPFDESTIVQLFAKIQAADFTYPSWFTPEVRSLLNQMLVAEPKERVSLAQLQHHPWYIGQGTAGIPLPAEAPAASAPINTTDLKGNDFADVEDHPEEQSVPVALNAFDLVSQCGGFMLDRMFSPEIFYTAAMEDTLRKNPQPIGTDVQKSVGGSILFGSATIKTKVYHFSSALDPSALSVHVYDALQAMGFDFEGSKDACASSGVIKASLLSAKGLLGMFIQVFSLSPTLSLLEIKKGKGDILEWNNAFSDLVDKRIVAHINKPPV